MARIPNPSPTYFRWTQFRFTGTRAARQREAPVEVPSLGFSWNSDPLQTSKCAFSILGDKSNGRDDDI